MNGTMQAPEVLSMPSPDSAPSPSSPEWHRLKPYDEKIDVWAVGILLHEMLTGRTPFEVDDATETGQRIMGAPLPLGPLEHLPADCIHFITSTLCKKPDQRPTAAELMHHAWLQRHLRGHAPNAGPRLQTFDIFEIANMRRAIQDCW